MLPEPGQPRPTTPTSPSGPPGPPKDQPRTIAQAAAELGIGYHKFRKLVAGHAVQCVRVGRTVRFYDADIAAAKEQFRETPNIAPVVPINRGRRAA